MKNKKFLIMALSLLLCAAMVLPFVFIDAGAEAVNFDAANIGTGFKGKKISILGDSISTYAGVSNDSAANSTIAGNAVYYKENNEWGITREDTWWQQAIDKLGLELCVNNSWAGSGVMGWDTAVSTENPAGDGTVDYTDYTYAAKSRAQQLHTANANPDIIAVYLGTNDVKNAKSGLSTFASDKNAMLSEAAGTGTSGVKKFSLYIRMVNKMLEKYPAAQIYLFTLLPNEAQNDVQIDCMQDYNQSIRDLVTYYQSQGKKVYLVDLYNDTSITRDFEVLKKHLANTLHPNDAGMDVITNCFLSSLVHKNEYSLNPDNWREIEYDLTDVYVSGGQINTKRFSSSDQAPVSVSLIPSRPEYGMEVTVKAHKADAGEEDTDENWKDITAQTYSGGTVFIRNMHYSYYDRVKITAKAVYTPKNFRWEMGSTGLTSCVMDGADYSISGTLTQNALALKNGSVTGGSFSDAQYQLSDSILLRNEEPWAIEWKAAGAQTKDMMIFSKTDTASNRSNLYLFSDNGKTLYIGYRNTYRSQYWNYGVTLPTGMDASTSHVYRLVNRVDANGSNMVYLYVDGTEVGAMNNFTIGGTAQTGDLATQTFLNGRDLEFSFMGAGTGHYLNDCSIEYIQVWEGGGYDTLRLQQLVSEYNNELKTTMASATGFAAYKSAVEAAEAFLTGTGIDRTQAQCDAHVKAIEDARNKLTASADATEIFSVELLTHNYVPIGKPTGLKIITTPDVQKIQVGDTATPLLTNSSALQTMKIGGVERQVKVWLVTWLRTDKTQKVVQYRIHALKDASQTASDANSSDASVTFEVPYGANCLALIKVTKQPDKRNYFVGETFDKTGMEVTAYYGDGSVSEVVTDFVVKNASTPLTAADKFVTIQYSDPLYGDVNVTVDLPIDVLVNVSELA